MEGKQIIRILHRKPDGRVIRQAGELVRASPQELVLRRWFTPGRVAVSDGLAAPILPGDWGILFLPLGAWFHVRTYHRASGALVGMVVNINTPPESPEPGVLSYLDLEVDVVRLPDGTVRVIDRPALRAAVEAGWVDPETARRAEETAAWLAAVLAHASISRPEAPHR
jgi:predicted RNA-binding protein associated with RNAse of E/G family